MTQAFDVEFDCLAHILFDLFFGRSGRYAAIEVWRISRISGFGFFNDNQILPSLFLPQAILAPEV